MVSHKILHKEWNVIIIGIFQLTILYLDKFHSTSMTNISNKNCTIGKNATSVDNKLFYSYENKNKSVLMICIRICMVGFYFLNLQISQSLIILNFTPQLISQNQIKINSHVVIRL